VTREAKIRELLRSCWLRLWRCAVQWFALEHPGPLKPETLADLRRYILAMKGVLGALHLQSIESKCPCEICALLRVAVAQQKAGSPNQNG
jgi:hypothetical protein